MKTFRRIVSPRQIDAQRRGSTRIAPGIWSDADGGMHFSVPELLAHFGWPDDAEHRALVEQAVREMWARDCPDATLIVQEEES